MRYAGTILFLLLFFYSLSASSQTDTIVSTPSAKIPFHNFGLFNNSILFDSTYADSSLENAHLYDLLHRNYVFIPRTGNLGSAHKDLYRSFGDPRLFTDGFHQYDRYLVNPFDIRSAAPYNRYSSIEFHLGSKKEQHLFLQHQQQFRPWFIAGLDFGAMASPGDFSRQLHTIRNFNLYLAYEAPSSVYRTYASFTSNRVNNEENGGIASDSVFENASTLDTKTLPVSLNNARTKIRTRDYLLKQELNISALFNPRDSLHKTKNFNNKSLVLSHTFWMNRKSNLFTSANPDSGYFSNYYFDSVLAYDSAFFNDIFQTLVLSYGFNAMNGSLIAEAGAGNQKTEYETSGTDTSFDSWFINGAIKYESDNFSVTARLNQYISSDFKNQQEAGMKLDYHPGRNNYFISLLYRKRPPLVRDIFYLSNHFIWLNEFDLTKEVFIHGGLQIDKAGLEADVKTAIFTDYIYYHSDMLPQVFNGSIATASLNVKHTLLVGKFGLVNRIQADYSGNDKVIRVPDFSAFSGLFYENNFFKNALKLRTGVDVRYHTSYYADGYMPATGIFFLQDEKKIGNYPYLDYYISLKIKTASIFFKLEHFNAGLIDRSYYGAYHYPLTGRAFKFGIKWDLKD